MRLAVAHAPPASDRATALARARDLAVAAASAGAALLVLPQRFAADRAFDHGSVMEAAEASDGPCATAMRANAGAAGIAILYGYVERCSGRNHDSLQLVDAQGRALANYRRAHLERGVEDGLFAPGQWLSAMPLGPRRLGLLSGYDLAFPEPARALRLIGCDPLLVAGGASDEPRTTATLLAARAIENACCLAYASAAPDQPALVLGPDGRPLARGTTDQPLVLADLPPLETRAEPALLGDRRPRLYHRLTVVEAGEG